jgi:hypothetical protein
MTPTTNAFTVPAAELVRLVSAVQRSAARSNDRPALAGIHVSLENGKLTATAADGFRLSTAHTLLHEPENTSPAILDRAYLLNYVKTIKPKYTPTVTITPAADAWSFATNGTPATIPTIDASYPDFWQIIGDGSEPALFAVNPRYFSDTLAAHGTDVIRVSRANDSPSAPLFFSADDGTRHVVMPMVVQDAERAPVATPEPAAEPEAAPAPVTPEESAFRTMRAARERRDVKRAARLAAAPASVTTHAMSCPDCGDAISDGDRYCGSCGLALAAPNAAELAHYSPANQHRILDQCPLATDVRGFRAWMDAGRVVRKGEKGIRIHAPVTANVDGAAKVVAIKPTYVFDVSQTDELPQQAAA